MISYVLLDGEIDVFVPSLHFWEFGNVLRTYVRRGELDEALAMETYDLHLAAPISKREPEQRKVLQIALQYGATVYDGVFITLSQELDARLLTAERTTTPWVARLGDRAVIVRSES